MSRIRITTEILENRIISDSPKLLGNFHEVSDFLSKVRKTYTEYKLDYNFLEKIISKYNDAEMLAVEYYFRNTDDDSSKLLSKVLPNIDTEGKRFSKYIKWCYSVGMSEKNQIRKRLEFFDPSWMKENKCKTITRTIRNYCNLI